MSLKYMILGALKENPTHGYGMVNLIFRDFSEQRPDMNSGQIYQLLSKLEAEGLAERRIVSQDKVPDKKVVLITPEGEEEFVRWLNSDEAEIEYTRYDFFNKYEFLYKVNYFNKLSAEERLAKINHQIQQMEKKLGNFIIAEESMQEKKIDCYRVFILQFGIEMQKAKIKWLKNLKQEVLESQKASLPKIRGGVDNV